jgi:hypothetical protein
MPPRQLTTEDKDAMKDLMKSLVGRTFVPDAGVTLGGQPVRDWLAGAAPSNPLGAMQHSMGRAACESWARGDGSGIPPRRDALMRDTCSPYIASIGTPPAGSTLGAPFTNGQCAGLTYHLRRGGTFVDYLDGVQIGTGTMATGTLTGTVYTGPITSVQRLPNTFGTTGLPNSWKLRITHNNGQTRDVVIDPEDRPPLGGRSERRIRSLSVSFVRTNGSSTTCGDPAKEWDGGNPGVGIPGPTTVPSPTGFDIPFPGVKVSLNPDGTIAIDFGDGGPPLVVDPGVEPAAGGGADPGPPEAGTPGATGTGGDDEGDAPEGKELWALKVTINSFPANPNQYAPGVYRGVCYVYMGDSNGLDHDPAGAMLRSGQLILAEREGLTKYRVAANVGYNLTVTPYWRTPRKEV